MSQEAVDRSTERWTGVQMEEVVNSQCSHYAEVIQKHEHLLGQLATREEECAILLDRLEESQDEQEELKKLLQSARTEYDELENKYETEQSCRQRAELYAAKVAKDNNKLRRHSQLLQLQTAGMTAEHGNNTDNTDGDDASVKLDDVADSMRIYYEEEVAKLKDDNARLKTELSDMREDYQAESAARITLSQQVDTVKTELTQTKQSLRQHQDALKRLTAASESAYREYEHLKGSYAQEILCRDKAEKYAATLFAEREAARRQSSMLLMNVAGDRRLMEAMLEVETLTTNMEKQRAHYERQVKELQEEVESLRDKESVESLEQENLQLAEERDSLHQRLCDLQRHYENLERKLEEARRPPPPPPPPPPPASPSKKLKLFGKKKPKPNETEEKAKGQQKDTASQALVEEMMKRIREGGALRPAPKPVKQLPDNDQTDGNSPMNELRGMLGKMRKGSFEKTQPARPTGREENSELAQAFLRLRKSSKSDQPSSSDEQSSSCQPPDSDQQVSSAGSEQNCCQLNESDRLPSPPQHPSFDQQPDCDQYSSPSQYINCQQQIDVSQQPDSKQENEQCDVTRRSPSRPVPKRRGVKSLSTVSEGEECLTGQSI